MFGQKANEKMRKVYRHIKKYVNKQLRLDDGKFVTIIFSNGTNFPIKLGGFFATNDEKIQRAIEASSAFGSEIFLEKTHDEKSKKEDLMKEIESAYYKSVSNIKTVQDAKSYISSNYPDFDMRKIRTYESIISFAKTKKLVFPELVKPEEDE